MRDADGVSDEPRAAAPLVGERAKVGGKRPEVRQTPLWQASAVVKLNTNVSRDVLQRCCIAEVVLRPRGRGPPGNGSGRVRRTRLFHAFPGERGTNSTGGFGQVLSLRRPQGGCRFAGRWQVEFLGHYVK